MASAAHCRRCSLLAVFLLLFTGCVLPVPPGDTTAGQGNDQFDPIQESLNNQAPVADAGDDQTVTAGESVRLDGTGSTDPDGDRLRYVWVQVSGTPVADIDQAFTSIVSFDAPADIAEDVTLTFSLTVTDGFAASVDQVQITLTPAD